MGIKFWDMILFGMCFIPLTLSAALNSMSEVPSLIPGSKSSQTDLYTGIPHWKQGEPAVLDMSVIFPMQQLTVKQSLVSQGHALAVDKDRKIVVHNEACMAAKDCFIPLISETFGWWSEKASDPIRYIAIGCPQGQRLGISPAESTTHFFHGHAVYRRRGNVSRWVRRIPIRPSEVDYLFLSFDLLYFLLSFWVQLAIHCLYPQLLTLFTYFVPVYYNNL